MSDKEKPPISVKLDPEAERALEYVLSKANIKRHAVMVAAVREGLRSFIQNPDRLSAAHAKEKLPIPEDYKSNTL